MDARNLAASIVWIAWGVFVAPAAAREDVLVMQLLDNPSFDEGLPVAGAGGAQQVPWWRTTKGAEQLMTRELEGGTSEAWLWVGGDASAEQPLAAYGPTAGGIVITARVSGAGRIVIVDGAGREHVERFEMTVGEEQTLVIGPLGELEAFALGVRPRLLVKLAGAGEATAYFESVRADVPLPAPTAAELREEVVALLEQVVSLWAERGLDREGPRSTEFACHRWDVVTGERLQTSHGRAHPLFSILGEALEVEERADWRALYEGHLGDWLELCFDPESSLPRAWETEGDEPVVRRAVEMVGPMRSLVDIIELGREPFATRAREHAEKIAHLVVERGTLPDGNVAAGYDSSDGTPRLDYIPLRRLGLPGELVRLGAATEGVSYTGLARDALATMEFTHSWTGSWERIDPGWDDRYGHYGSHALTMWEAAPEEISFRRFVLDGWHFFAPLWEDSLRLGGFIAADQVRCWGILKRIVELEESERPLVRERLRAALRSHFKGEQYETGAWGDVTVYRYDPKTNLEIGDLPGLPLNLLLGIATLYGEDLGHSDEELRALFASVLRSSVEHYRRDFGYLVTRTQRAGANPCGGSIRLGVALAELLQGLSEGG
jgi:hypothetical protein